MANHTTVHVETAMDGTTITLRLPRGSSAPLVTRIAQQLAEIGGAELIAVTAAGVSIGVADLLTRNSDLPTLQIVKAAAGFTTVDNAIVQYFDDAESATAAAEFDKKVALRVVGLRLEAEEARVEKAARQRLGLTVKK